MNMLYTNQIKLMEAIKRVGLIDFLFLLLVLRIGYIAVSKGVTAEIFKTLGISIGSFFAFQYYPSLAEQINKKVIILNKAYLDAISFLLIFIGIVGIFSLLRRMVAFLVHKKEISLQERRVSLCVGILRYAFFSSAMIFFLYLSPLNPEHFEKSISFKLFKNIAPKMYLTGMSFYNKFEPAIVTNKEVKKYYEAKESLSRIRKKRR
ncbi:MAG: CvpA family protein [Candidatus Omnitrophota bacterium]|nr:MAG: CvpA family protein [Candidatus Omnitrophota bacterium]